MLAPQPVVEAAQAVWLTNIDAAMSFSSPQMVYRLNLPNSSLPIGGETIGRDAFFAVMKQNREILEYLVHKPTVMAAEGEMVRTRTELLVRHRDSRELLSVVIRSTSRVVDGLIVSLEEVVDAPMVEAFLAFFAGKRPT